MGELKFLRKYKSIGDNKLMTVIEAVIKDHRENMILVFCLQLL